MSQAYKAGTILQAAFSGRVDGQIKPRPVLYWMNDANNPSRILISGIFGTATQRKWEYCLHPNSLNGLTKECYVRIDSTQYIPLSSILKTRGTLNEIEFNFVKKLLLEYSEEYKSKSPEDFNTDPFDIF